jgi:hypothetical protein
MPPFLLPFMGFCGVAPPLLARRLLLLPFSRLRTK